MLESSSPPPKDLPLCRGPFDVWKLNEFDLTTSDRGFGFCLETILRRTRGFFQLPGIFVCLWKKVVLFLNDVIDKNPVTELFLGDPPLNE